MEGKLSIRNAGQERIRRVRRALSRGVTLVEVLIVVAIMATIAGGAVVLVFPEFKKARIKSAVIGGTAIRTAAETYREIDGSGGDACPTIADLVAARKIDRQKTDDPWGTPYKIVCDGSDIHVVSAGNDRREGTPDDVRDDLKQTEVEAHSKK